MMAEQVDTARLAGAAVTVIVEKIELVEKIVVGIVVVTES